MHHKCGAHDRGSGAGAIKYLLGLYDSKGQLRADVQVLRGDPKQIAQLIDSLKFNCRYTSEVIAWAKEDDPTPEEIEAVLDDHERVTFAGLRKSQYTRCAVLHTEDDGSKHLHIITPRVCLESGRSINIAPPGHEYYFAKWRNTWNLEKGWARPDDPARARLVQPGKKAYLPADELRSKLEKPNAKESKEEISNWLIERIKAGELVNRTDILEALNELVGDFGEITRVGKDYVSVRLAEGAKPLRLKGLLYGDNFSPELVSEVGRAQAERPAGRAKPDRAAAADARAKLDAAIENRTRYNIERYSKPARNSHNVPQLGKQGQREQDKRVAQAVEYRSRYLEQADREAHEVADVVAHGHDHPSLPGDVRRDASMDMVRSGQSQQSSGENNSGSTDRIKADEPRLLQPTNEQKILPLTIAKNYPIIIAKNYNVNGSQSYPLIIAKNYNIDGWKFNILDGEKNNGLHQPDVRSPAAWPIYQHTPRFNSLSTLPRRDLAAVRTGAAVLLPTNARFDVDQRSTGGAGALRRTNSVTGPATEAAGGVKNDPVRAAINEFFATVDRLTHAAGAAVNQCIERASAALRKTDDLIDRADTDVKWCSTKSVNTNRVVEQACESINKNSNGVKIYMDDELDRFKDQISLFDLAQHEFGYQFIASESSKSYFVMKKGDDKIIITTDKRQGKDPHDVYINTGNRSDSGTIIDFVKNRVGDNNIKLVRVRQCLRAWAPGAKKPAAQKPKTAPVKPAPITRNIAKVVADWTSMKPYSRSYLTKDRGLTPEIIKAFDVREDPEHGNACFKHRKPGEGVVGYEYKNAPAWGQDKTFTGFAEGGEKALFVGRLDDLPVSRLVVVEAAIDALSYAQTKHLPGTVYISTGGTMSTAQTEQLKAMITGNPKAVLVLATDNDLFDKDDKPLAFDDRPGEIAAKEIAAMAPAGMTIERDTPIAKDWNKDLTDAIKAHEVARIQQALQRAIPAQNTYERDR